MYKRQLAGPRVLICVPAGVTQVEKRAVIDISTDAGAREAFLIEELEKMGTGKLRLAAVEGDVKEGSVMSGQVASLSLIHISCLIHRLFCIYIPVYFIISKIFKINFCNFIITVRNIFINIYK